MSESVLPPLARRHLPVEDGRRFEVGRIWCVGRNYADHAREMGGDPVTEAPFFFSKPVTSLTGAGEVAYPPETAELHHEVEMVVALGHGGRDLEEAAARRAIFAVAVGVDLTRRDVQAEARSRGRPWDLAKGFDAAAPIGILRAVDGRGAPATGSIELDVNGQKRQRGSIDQMILGPEALLVRLSRQIELLPGDLLMTGTPAGVGPVLPGDRVRARIGSLRELEFSIRPPC